MTYVSPSQIQTWRGCKRKWAYSRSRPRTQNKHAEFGTAMHRELELWLTGQRPPDTCTLPGKTALAGLVHLPLPGTCEVEKRIDLSIDGVHYIGYADVHWYDPETLCVNVIDHKSCGSFDHCLTEDALETDPQFLVYTMAGLVQHPEAIMARGQWNYLQRATNTRPGRARPVKATMSAYRIRERFLEMHRQDGVAIASASKDPEDHPREGADTGECDRYGGCPYAAECWANQTKPVNVAAVLAANPTGDDD